MSISIPGSNHCPPFLTGLSGRKFFNFFLFFFLFLIMPVAFFVFSLFMTPAPFFLVFFGLFLGTTATLTFAVLGMVVVHLTVEGSFERLGNRFQMHEVAIASTGALALLVLSTPVLQKRTWTLGSRLLASIQAESTSLRSNVRAML